MGLTRITSQRETAQAVNKLLRTFRVAGQRATRVLGFRGGQEPVDQLYVVDAAGIWLGYRQLENRHWCSFGPTPLPEKGPVSITVEINPPLEGINRRIKGLLAADESGAIYLCHDGGVGGGKKGIGKSAFLEWLGRDCERIVDPDGGHTLAFPVAEIGSERMIQQLAEYTRAVADFKAGKPAPIKQVSTPAFAGSDKEFEGNRSVPARDSHTASCDHGIVRNRLHDLIKATGLEPTRDQARDLIVGDPATPDAEFEIKTSAEPQSIYTAVGQLFIHCTTTPARHRVAVLPEPVPRERSEALASLNIDLVTYSWTKTHIQFTGLDRIITGVADQAPIIPQSAT